MMRVHKVPVNNSIATYKLGNVGKMSVKCHGEKIGVL